MNLKLTEHNRTYLESRVESGDYPDIDTALNVAIELLEVQESESGRLRQLMDRGITDYDQGKFAELSDDLIGEINERAASDAGTDKPVRAHVRP